jgi:small ligand-binding sensory domain FIST
MSHDRFVAHLAELPADPRGVRPGFQCDPTARDLAEDLLDSLRCGRQVVFQNHLTGLIQDAVMGGTISQIQTDGQLGLFENLVFSLLSRCYSFS